MAAFRGPWHGLLARQLSLFVSSYCGSIAEFWRVDDVAAAFMPLQSTILAGVWWQQYSMVEAQ
jgi:hypothetical protein